MKLVVFLLAALSCRAQEQWRKLAPIPDQHGVAGPFAGFSGGALLVAGGANFPDKMPWEGGAKVWHDKVWILTEPSGKWREAGKLPRPLAYGVSVRWAGVELCFGGCDAEKHYSEAFALRHDGGKVSVLEVKDLKLPVPLAYAAGVRTNDGRIYIGCGSSEPGDGQVTNRVFTIHLNARREGWQALPLLPAEPRILPIASVSGRAFYLFGGATIDEVDGKRVRRYLRDAWRFTAETGWKRLADMPKPCAAAPSPAPLVGGRMLIIGGDDGSQVNSTPFDIHPGFSNSVLAYHLESNTWTESGKCPAPRATVPCVSWRDEFVIPSGEVRPGVRSPEVWALRPPDKK